MLDFSQTLSEKALIHPSCRVKNCRLGPYTELGTDCVLEETELGAYSYCFGGNDIIYARIGKFASIATGVRINPVQHPHRIRAASHHFTYRCAHYGFGPDDDSLIEWRRANRVEVGHDVWMGHGAIIMGGVTIGHGAVIAAGAVVTHDVRPYEIVGGVPAKNIGWRYDEDTIAAMLRIKWWDWSHEELAQRVRDFDDIASFVEKYDKKS